MKPTVPKWLQNPFILALLILAAVLVTLYFSWPSLVQNATGRAQTLIVTTILGLGAIGITFWRKNVADTLTAERLGTILPDDAARDLRQQLDAAFSALKELSKAGGPVVRARPLRDLPWILISGPPGSGRAKAFAASEQKIHRSIQIESHGQLVVTLLLTDYALYLLEGGAAAPGALLPQSQPPPLGQMWEYFLGYLAAQRARPVNAVLLILSVDQFWSAQEAYLHQAWKSDPQVWKNHPKDIARVIKIAEAQQQMAESTAATELRNRVHMLRERLQSDFDVYILFSKSDHIDGFTEFFSGLSREKRGKQSFGFELHPDWRSEELSAGVARRIASLLPGLVERLGLRILQPGAPPIPEAVWALVREIEEKAPRVARLIERFMLETPRYRAPRLVEVFFGSAIQDGSVLPGPRALLQLHGDVVVCQPRNPPPPDVGGPILLEAMWRRITDRAAAAVRPDTRRQFQGALLISVLGCGFCAWVMVSLVPRFTWLVQIRKAVRSLHQQALVEAHDEDASTLISELALQGKVLDLLCRPDPPLTKGAQGLDGPPVCPARPRLREAHAAVTNYLISRSDCVLVRPFFRSSAQNPRNSVYSMLRQAAGSAKGGPDQDGVLQRGYYGLKAATLLQHDYKRAGICPGATDNEDRQWMQGFLSDLWGNAGDRKALSRSLRFFSYGYLDLLTPSVFPINQAAIDQARVALNSDPKQTPDDVVVQLVISESAVSKVRPLLEGGQLFNDIVGDFSNNKIPGQLTDNSLGGIADAYTMAGCVKLFSNQELWRVGNKWWRCALNSQRQLGEQEAASRPMVEKKYPELHMQAWRRWLSSIGLRSERAFAVDPGEPEGALKKAGEIMGMLPGELAAVFMLVGTGTEAPAKIELPAPCQRACERFSLFRAALGKGPIPDPSLANVVKEYTEEAARLGGLLSKLADKNAEGIEAVQNAYKTLDNLGQKREAMFEAFRAAANRYKEKVCEQEAEAAQLNELLQKLERNSLTALHYKAGRMLDGFWGVKVINLWSKLKYQGSRETPENAPQRCDAVRAFLTGTIEQTVNEKLASFYKDLPSCEAQRFGEASRRRKPAGPGALARPERAGASSEPGTKGVPGDIPFIPILEDNCNRINNALRVAQQKSCPKPPTPGGSTAAPEPKQRAERTEPEVSAQNTEECQVSEIFIDTKNLGSLYRCSTSTGACWRIQDSRGTAGVTIKRLRNLGHEETSEIPIKTDVSASTTFATYLGAFQRQQQPFRGDTRVAHVFQIKEEAQGCRGVKISLYLDRFFGPEAPKRAPSEEDWWKQLALPEKLSVPSRPAQ